jgi:hypothetical protein
MASQKLLESLSDINAIADSMDQLVKLAGYLTGGTNWSAQQLVTAYLSYGMMHGWNIAQTMEKMNVIKGKITYQAATMFGIVIASSKCKSWKVLTNSDTECSLEFVRADNNQKYTVQFTIEMAQRQGLTNNRQWQTMPKQMLMARCKSMAVRDVFGDVISGYDAVEIADSMDMSEEERLEILNSELDTQITTRQTAPAKPKAQVKTQPMQPVQVQPVQPVQVQPTQPVQPVQHAQPAQPVQPVQVPPAQSKSPQPAPFPSEQKSAITQHAYNNTSMRKKLDERDMDLLRELDEDEYKELVEDLGEDEARHWKRY